MTPSTRIESFIESLKVLIAFLQILFFRLLHSLFLLVRLVARVDPVGIHVDGLGKMRDVARVLLAAHRALHQAFFRQVVHLRHNRFVMVTERAREHRVHLRGDLLRGGFAGLALALR